MSCSEQASLKEIVSTFNNPNPVLSMRDKAKLIGGIIANVSYETQQLLNDFLYKIDNRAEISEDEWKSISRRITTDLADRANQQEVRSLAGRALGDLLEEPFVSSFVRQVNEEGYSEVKIRPNISNRAGFDIYCINPKTRRAVVIELKNWSKTTTLHKMNIGDNYLVKRLVQEIDGIEITIVCEILVMFGGYIASTIKKRFSSEGVYIIQYDEKIKPDQSVSKTLKSIQFQRIEDAARRALGIVKKILGLKEASGLDLRRTKFKIALDGKVESAKIVNNPTFNDEYRTLPYKTEEDQSFDPSQTIIIVPDTPVVQSYSAVIVLKTLFSKRPD